MSTLVESPRSSELEAYVASSRSRFVEQWRTCCTFASVSAEGRPELEECADWLAQRAESVFDRVIRVPVPGQAPVLIATLDGTGPTSLLLYSHYDVQPAGDDTLWRAGPFEASIDGGRLVARGCCDDKSDVMARIQAVEAFVAAHGRPTFTIVWLCEGAEEIGSPGLADVLREQRSLVAADGCLWESYLRRDDGRPEVAFGCRGILYVELSLRVGETDRHGVFASAYRSASVDLVRALASLLGDDGRVVIEGFYDGLLALDQAVLDTADAPQPDGDDPSVLLAVDAREFGRRLLFEPSLSIAGLEAGHTGEGVKTSIPASARAKLDIRLLPGQHPDDVLAKLRGHLDARGFEQVTIDVLSQGEPALSPADTPLAAEVLAASTEIYGPPVAYPVAGSGPMHLIGDGLGIPLVMPAGTTRPGGAIHASNENAAVADYVDHVRFTARVLERLHLRGGLV